MSGESPWVPDRLGVGVGGVTLIIYVNAYYYYCVWRAVCVCLLIPVFLPSAWCINKCFMNKGMNE